jgi:hypothetical protein
MFSDTQDAESEVATLLIFSDRPSDLDWSVAQVKVAPLGSLPLVQ